MAERAPTPLPTYLQIEPVGQCNLRCQMCSIQFRRDGPPHGPPAFMSFETFARIVDQFPALERLHLQGLGEPMMHPRFFDMVEYATERGIETSTNSNITLLTRSRAERCVRSGLSWLHASIDGASATTYERIRVRSRLGRVLDNLGELVRARRSAGTGLPRVRLVMVLMRQNLAELPEVVRLAQRFEIETVHVQRLCHDFSESTLPAHYRPMRDFVSQETLLNEPLEAIEARYAEAREVAADLGIELRLPAAREKPHPVAMHGRERCDWPWTGAYISYDGQAMPCCMVSTPDRASFGNVVTHGLKAIWNGDEAETFRAQLAGGPAPEVCQSCSVYHGTF